MKREGGPEDVVQEDGRLARFDPALAFRRGERVGDFWREHVWRQQLVNAVLVLYSWRRAIAFAESASDNTHLRATLESRTYFTTRRGSDGPVQPRCSARRRGAGSLHGADPSAHRLPASSRGGGCPSPDPPG